MLFGVRSTVEFQRTSCTVNGSLATLSTVSQNRSVFRKYRLKNKAMSWQRNPETDTLTVLDWLIAGHGTTDQRNAFIMQDHFDREAEREHQLTDTLIGTVAELDPQLAAAIRKSVTEQFEERDMERARILLATIQGNPLPPPVDRTASVTPSLVAPQSTTSAITAAVAQVANSNTDRARVVVEILRGNTPPEAQMFLADVARNALR